MWSFWRDRTLQFCLRWMEAYEADMLSSLGGGGVVGVSGGGESETRGDYGAAFTTENIRCCRRRMSMIDPTKYPPLSTRQKPDFSSWNY